MENDKPERPPPLSDTDRARLDELLEEREFEDKLSKRRKLQMDAAKAWAQWLTSMAAAVIIIKELGSAAWKQIVAWVGS